MPPASPKFSDLPYFDDYVKEILRPRVDGILNGIGRSLNESVWRQLIKLLAAEQPNATEGTAATIQSLLERELGLRLEASITAKYGDAASQAEPRTPEVVTNPVRPAVRPGTIASPPPGSR